MVVVGDAIWLTPHGFVPTAAKLVAELELPSDWNFLAFDAPAKNSAAFTLCSSRRQYAFIPGYQQGTIIWGKIDFGLPVVLDLSRLQPQLDDGVDGRPSARCCGSTTTYNLLPDSRGVLHSYAVIFRLVDYRKSLSSFSSREFAIIVTLRPSDSKGHAPEGDPVPPGSNQGAERLLKKESLHVECDKSVDGLWWAACCRYYEKALEFPFIFQMMFFGYAMWGCRLHVAGRTVAQDYEG